MTLKASPPDVRGQLHTAVLTAAELLRLLGCALVGTAAVAWGVAIFLGASFPTGISLAENCPNAVYRTGPSAALPDCRAYELVTPPEKNGGYINQGQYSSSPEGLAVAYTSNAGFAGATSDLNASTGYQSSRATEGWDSAAQTENEAEFINHHADTDRDFAAVSFGDVETRGDRELEGGVRLWQLQRFGLPEADLDLYLTRRGGVNELVGPTVPPTSVGLDQALAVRASDEEMGVLGMSADVSHIVFEDPEPAGLNQWSFATKGALLEYIGAGHTEPELVVPNPATEDNGCATQALGGGVKHFANLQNPISTHGEKTFFTDGGPEPQCQGKGELFARVEDAGERPHTVAISEPTKEDCSTCETFEQIPGEPEFAKRAPAEFVGASENGSKVFFYTTQPLLNGQGGLYEYDFTAPEGSKVIHIASGAVSPIIDGAEEPRALVSQDGSHVYFVSEAVLTQEPSPGAQGENREGNAVSVGAVAQSGAQNLYGYEQDEQYPQGHISFVATLNSKFRTDRNFSLTPNGRFLVLQVRGELTQDDTTNNKQVFEYDVESHSLLRVSIGDNGYNDDGNGFDADIPEKRAFESSYNPSAFLDTLTVSEDGADVFFQSGDGLTPRALNRVVVGSAALNGTGEEPTYAENVYEYHNGHVYLISDGQDISSHVGSQVHLLSTDLTGKDVFFTTTDQLVGQDTDSNKDIYDARIEGGFPAPVRPVACSGDACQGQLSPSPVLLSPGSEFQAGGNPTPGAPALAPAVVTSKPKTLTNAQRLAAALKTCRRQPRKQQAKCVAAARKRYAPVKKKRGK